MAEGDCKNGAKTAGRDGKGRFASGNAGKPRGAKHQTTLLAERLLSDDLEAVARVVVDQAKDGNMLAARIVLDKALPNAKERRIALDLPDTSTAEGVSQAAAAVLQAVAAGDITPGEGATLAGIIEARRKAIETNELERRIAALESEKESR